VRLATLRLGEAGPALITELPKATPANLSVAVSQMAYPGGAERIGSSFTSKRVVVNKDNVAGAWAGAVLARANHAPLLVLDGKSLSKEQKAEISRLGTVGLYVIGDESSIPQSLVDEISKAGVITNLAAIPTTTTPAAPTTVAGAPATTTTLPTSTADKSKVIRLTGATPADIGKAVAGAMDVRSAEEKSRSLPAFASGAVAVNAASEESAAGLAFAAALRMPVLFVDRDGVPAPTAEAFTGSNVQTTFVIGGPEAIADSAMTRLPGAKRLGGADMAATTAAVVKELQARGLPVNVAYVADQSRPVDAAIAAAAVSRSGGFLLLTPGADTGAAEEQIAAMGLGGQVDQLVKVESNSPGNVPWALIAVFAVFAIAGVVLLDRAAKKKRSLPPGTGPSVATPRKGAQAGH
jgi:hypothetical protein